MGQHDRWAAFTGYSVFVCNPHLPTRQRTNKCTNGLTRDWYPKGENFRTTPDRNLADMEYPLYGSPRQNRGWATLLDKLAELATSVTLAL